jgi:hypothetical protein
MNHGMIRLELERPAVLLDCLGHVSLSAERVGEVVKRISVIGLERQGAPITGNGVVEPAHFLEHVAQVAMGVGVVGLELYAPLQARECSVDLSLRVEREPQVVECLGVVGLEAEHAFVGSHRLGNLALEMDGAAQQEPGLGDSRIGRHDLPKDVFGWRELA